jgi:cytoskeletal protein CcmA (bactofilin family)
VPQVRVLPGAFFLGENIMAFGSEKRSDSSDYESSSQSFFGKTMRIEGEVTSNEDLTIEGKIKGQLQVSKTLTIGKEGYVDGDISANVVHISGKAEGHLSASKRLVISSEGKYTGNISADTIKVAEGAQIKGTINTEEKIITITEPPTQEVEEEAEPPETMYQFQEKKEPPQEQELKDQDPTKPAEKKEETKTTK